MERGSENGENMANLCRNNCGFFGNPATNNLCSKCYKLDCSLRSLNNSSIDSKESKNLEVEFKHVEHVGASEETPVDFAVKEPAIRCAVCNKKVGLTAFKCRCENMFCWVHRYSDKHSCNFDYRRLGQDAIAKANPIIKADKIDKI